MSKCIRGVKIHVEVVKMYVGGVKIHGGGVKLTLTLGMTLGFELEIWG